ncbi:MAG: hypothetical protein L6Q78_15815 [Bacteroidia bacterium]|nr:hypothetical protein [Bacteroidia bacterium]
MSNNPVLFTDPLGLWDGRGANVGEFRFGDGAWYVFLGGKEGWMLAEDQNDKTYQSVINYYRERSNYLLNFPPQPDNEVGWTKKFQYAIEQNRPGLEFAAKVCEYTPELVLLQSEVLAVSGKVVYEGGALLLKQRIKRELAENAAELAAKTGLTNPQLVQRAASFADDFVPFTKNAGVTGTLKHQAANRYLHLYQLRNGQRGLSTNVYFNNGVGNRGFLDVLDR